MIAGHFLLAFTLVAAAGWYLDLETDMAVKLGILAGAFAMTPDIDLVFAVTEIPVFLNSGFYQFTDSFWQASQMTHRGITHSLVTLFFVATGLTFINERKSRAATSAFLISITAYSFIIGGLMSAVSVILMASLGVFLVSRSDFNARYFSLAAFTGLMLHPLGDIFTGVPPTLLYPFDVTLVGSRLVLVQEPVLNLLALLGIEIFLGWTALTVYSRIGEKGLIDKVSPLTSLALAMLFVAPFLQPPTLSTSYQFVFSLVTVSLTGTGLTSRRSRNIFSLSVNFLSIMTAGTLLYLVFYLV